MIPPQISALTGLSSLRLNNNQFRGSAGSFLCIPSLSNAGPGSLHLANNLLSCIVACVANIAGSGNYDNSVIFTPVGDGCVNQSLNTASPTLAPTTEPTTNPFPNPTATPTASPTAQPTVIPTANPSPNPTIAPSP